MISAARYLGLILLFLSPSVADAASIEDLSCDKLLVNYVGAGEYAVLDRATLSGDQFRGHVAFGLKERRWTPKDLQDARRDLMLGFQLDDGVTTGIHTSITTHSNAVDLDFTHLKRGKHRLRIGIIFHGELSLDSAYCFSAPGYATWTN